MGKVIFVKATGLVAGWVDRDNRLEEEINNIVNSELGGAPDDYAFVDAPNILPGTMWAIERGAAVLVDNPKFVARKEARERAQSKLKALGLTDDEIAALQG